MKIAVGAITRRREAMFTKLLNSFVKMDLPSEAEIEFIFAENDRDHHVTDIVNHFQEAIGKPVTLLLEPSPGIPAARNAVLDYARDAGFDYLTFVDDDELVAKDWLVALMQEVTDKDLDLAGGPVLPVAEAQTQTFSQKSALALFQRRADGRNGRRSKSEFGHTGRRHALYTNNWCVNLKTAARLDQRFDESLRFTGGSDTKFCLDFQNKGAKTGWVPDARVDDVLPLRRLNLTYVFQRARDQCTNAAVLRDKPKGKVLMGIPHVALTALVLLMIAPIAGPATFGKAIFKFGLVAGRWNYVVGRGSSHYAPGTEHLHTEGSA